MRKLLLILAVMLTKQLLHSQWQLTSGPTNPAVKLLQTNQYLLAGCGSVSSSNGVYRTNTNGNSWTSLVNGGVTGSISGLAENNGNIFASQANQIFISTNYGMNWALVTNGLPSGFVYCLNSFNNTVYAGGSGISITTNNGLNWTTLTTTWTSATTALYIDQNMILAGTQNGKIYKSTNNGVTWANISTGLTGTNITKILVSNNTYITGDSDGIFKTTNGGLNWSETSSTATYISDLLSINGYYFASSSVNGVLASLNGGTTWFTLNDGLPINQIACLANNNDFLFAGVNSSHVYRRPLTELINIDTCFFSIHDTSYVTITDTTFFNIYDTTQVAVYDTIYSELIDTSYVNIFDTLQISVYDTSYVSISDTTFYDLFDTTYVSVFDTTFYNYTDTTYITAFDTVYINITDTTFISVTDTLFINTLITSEPDIIINTIKVYPNPAGSVITIHNGDFSLMNGYYISIANSSGQTVFQEFINQSEYIVNTAALGNAGIYYFRIYNPFNSIIQNRKIIIQ